MHAGKLQQACCHDDVGDDEGGGTDEEINNDGNIKLSHSVSGGLQLNTADKSTSFNSTSLTSQQKYDVPEDAKHEVIVNEDVTSAK